MTIAKLSIKICNWMDSINHKTPEENKVIQYGLELVLDNIIKFILIQLVGFLIGLGMETFVILFSFCGLRYHAGGIHAKTGMGCTLSMFVMWSLSLLVYMFFDIKLFFIPYIYIICFSIIVFCAPRTKNIDYFSCESKIKKKICSLIFFSVLILIAVLKSELRELIIIPVTIEVLSLLPKNIINEKGER